MYFLDFIQHFSFEINLPSVFHMNVTKEKSNPIRYKRPIFLVISNCS